MSTASCSAAPPTRRPYILAEVDRRFFDRPPGVPTRAEAIEGLLPYIERHLGSGGRLNNVVRHVLGLYHGEPRARVFRRHLSENAPREAASLATLIEAVSWSSLPGVRWRRRNRERRRLWIFGIPAGEIALLIAALLVAGVAAGFLAGLLGIGGGGVLVPVLYEVFRVLDVDPAIRMHLVLGTTLAIILPTSLKSFAGHRARGSVDMPLLKRVAPFIVAGVVARHDRGQVRERRRAQMGVGHGRDADRHQDGVRPRGLAPGRSTAAVPLAAARRAWP